MSALAAYEAGLAGADCWVSTSTGRQPLPLGRWTAPAGHRDRQIVEETVRGLRRGGRVLDVGCGPGRLTEAVLVEGARRGLGLDALGVDVSTTAVALARARGVPVVQADVLADLAPDPLGAGCWDRVLLADGNLGIGGDPVQLLRRARGLLAPGGRVVADVRPHGGVVRTTALIEAGSGGATVGGELPWAWVGAAGAAAVGRGAGLRLHALHRGSGHLPIAVWAVR